MRSLPSSQIQAIERWKSDTYERYIRHPTLLQAVSDMTHRLWLDLRIRAPLDSFHLSYFGLFLVAHVLLVFC